MVNQNVHDTFLALKRKAEWCYNDSFRFYHNWEHVMLATQQAQSIYGDRNIPESVFLALWYHDAIYVPGSSNNESQSAALMLWHAKLIDYRPPLGDQTLVQAAAYICNTVIANHMSLTWKPESEEQAVVMDCDLASLGDPFYDRFVQTQDKIAAEVHGPWVLNPDSGDARELAKIRFNAAMFLRSFLLKPSIYHTDRCRSGGRETMARTNIERFVSQYGRI